MSMPVKLSDALVLDARIAGEALDRSIAGQVEFWARLGRAIEPVINGEQALALSRKGAAQPLAKLLDNVDKPAGKKRLAQHLSSLPFPHYEPHPDHAGLLIRISADGTRTVGRFVNRAFVAV
jgi:ParD-like antitoxin of type II bacterial toxin-antitoxin system